MSVRLIAMLTCNDQTVGNALEVFEGNKMAPTNCWGFKDTGIEEEKSARLVQEMKGAGKTTFFESLVEKEEECLRAAQFALDNKFDYLIGMNYYDSVNELFKGRPIKYFPTCGKRSGIPRMLHGSIDAVIADGKRVQQTGVDGLCLSAYRFTGGDPEGLAERFIDELDVPVIMTGSINTNERLDVVKRLKPWGLTVGSAFFKHDFGKELSVAGQIGKVVDYLDRNL